MSTTLWVLGLAGLLAGVGGGYLIGRRSKGVAPLPTPSTTKPEEPELLGESPTSAHHDLLARMPAIWDGDPTSAPASMKQESSQAPLELQPVPQAEVPAGWRLVFVAGDSRCPDVELNRPRLRVGRREGCDIHIPDSGVSKSHADVLLLKDGVAVIDLHSVNGTWINNSPIPPGEPTLVQPGDRLAFSSFEFTLVFEGMEPKPGAPRPAQAPRPQPHSGGKKSKKKKSR